MATHTNVSGKRAMDVYLRGGGDIQIGAVEIKDGASDTRATVTTTNALRTTGSLNPDRFQATITSSNATSATQVKAKTAAKNIYILSIIISVGTAMSVQLQDDAGTPAVLMEQVYLAPNGGMAMNFPPEAPLLVATNQDLDVITSAAGNISVTVTGYVV